MLSLWYRWLPVRVWSKTQFSFCNYPTHSLIFAILATSRWGPSTERKYSVLLVWIMVNRLLVGSVVWQGLNLPQFPEWLASMSAFLHRLGTLSLYIFEWRVADLVTAIVGRRLFCVPRSFLSTSYKALRCPFLLLVRLQGFCFFFGFHRWSSLTSRDLGVRIYWIPTMKHYYRRQLRVWGRWIGIRLILFRDLLPCNQTNNTCFLKNPPWLRQRFLFY